jgi:hypothetical protein
MDTTAILKKISDARKAIVISEHNLDAQNLLDDLALSLHQDIVRQTITAGHRKQYNAVLAFAKHCASLDREAMKGAYMAEINGQARQVMLDGYVAVAFKRPWDGLPMVKDGVKPIEAQPVFEGAEKGDQVELPDLYEMIGTNKAWKARHKPGEHLLTKLGISYANTDYLIKVMQMLGITGGTCYVRTTLIAILIKSHNGEGLVLSVRLYGEKPESICWNYKEENK